MWLWPWQWIVAEIRNFWLKFFESMSRTFDTKVLDLRSKNFKCHQHKNFCAHLLCQKSSKTNLSSLKKARKRKIARPPVDRPKKAKHVGKRSKCQRTSKTLKTLNSHQAARPQPQPPPPQRCHRTTTPAGEAKSV